MLAMGSSTTRAASTAKVAQIKEVLAISATLPKDVIVEAHEKMTAMVAQLDLERPNQDVG